VITGATTIGATAIRTISGDHATLAVTTTVIADGATATDVVSTS
jgi:hypothetical protein